MKWLDLYIDGIHDGIQRWAPMNALTVAVGPFSVVGSLINALFCGVLFVGGASMLVIGEGLGLPMLVVAAAMEVVFVRVHVRARRGDFDPYIKSDDDTDTTPR